MCTHGPFADVDMIQVVDQHRAIGDIRLGRFPQFTGVRVDNLNGLTEISEPNTVSF